MSLGNTPTRALRANLTFPLTFWEDDVAVYGFCINISESGLLASFNRLPEVWITGKLELRGGGVPLILQARVARINQAEVGLSFLFRSEREREAVRVLVNSAAARAQMLHGQPPF